MTLFSIGSNTQIKQFRKGFCVIYRGLRQYSRSNNNCCIKTRSKLKTIRGNMSLQPQVTFNTGDTNSNNSNEKEEEEGFESVGWCALQGPREGMEDVVHVVKDGPCGYLYAGVFDGHGGAFAAEWLKDQLFGVILQALEQYQKKDSQDNEESSDHHAKENGSCSSAGLRKALYDSFHEADSRLLKFLATQDDEIRSQAGSTATVALIGADKAIIANVGDSRAVLCCDDNKFVDLSSEHRVWGRGSQVQSESQRVEEAGGWIKDGRVCDILAVSRAFGDWEFKGEGLQDLLKYGVREGFWKQDFAEKAEFKSDPIISTPDITEIQITDKDQAVVVATDGLWDVMDSLEVTRYVRQNFTRRRDPQWIAEGLANLALKRYTADNVGVVVIDVWGDERWAKAAEARKSRSQLFGIF
eukprot:TRINITY_DN1438_c1_g1_i17.p1 TRINITY_DN1438_c1_g1~~TRINITY_DN1438_c1_g1_i17.p1  ORF type:complete len:412 (+),score=57.97 TRINITY_DN1438_c1_g1_i17:2494-3729(+)